MQRLSNAIFYISILTFTFCVSCTSEKETSEENFEVDVILREEPDRLNPMLSKSSMATQIESQILLPLMEYNPENLQIQPVLVKDQPVVVESDSNTSFTYEIREEAVWADGQPVTADDYLFTIKAALNPHSLSNTWRGFLSQIDNIQIDSDNPKKFTVTLDEAYLLALPVTCNFNIYPRHYYDSEGLLNDYALDEMKADSIGGNAEIFGKKFNRPVFSRDSILGSGPYSLTSWTTGQSLVLTKKDNWWGDEALTANPERINYLFVPDEATGITMLKSGEADIISGVSPTVFAKLKHEGSEGLEFHTPQIMQYYYLGLNNDSPLLSDKRVRKALSHILDLEVLSDILMANLAKPIASPIHSSKTYYNQSLTPVSFDEDQARTLLAEAGWSDSDGDNILDKDIEGTKEKLSLDILVTQKELGRNLALILKENAGRVGIEINIKSQEWGQILKSIGQRDFHIVAMATRQHPGVDDLYQTWHTSSIGPDGRNITGFGNDRSDAIIERLRLTNDENERRQLFNEIQQIIYDEQPMIFLFAPTETIIHNDQLEMTISSLRPGYFEATAQRKK